MKRFITLLLAVCSVAAGAQPEIVVYDTFEEFEHILNTEDDKTYVVNFWATWCKPCIEELPYFEELTENYDPEKVKVILVSLDLKKHLDRKLIPFIKKRKLKSDVVLLADSKSVYWIDKVDEDWSGAIPATLIFDKDDYLFIEADFSDYLELNDILQSFINS